MFRVAGMIVIVGFIVFSFNSCKKITTDQLVNGLWKLDEVYIDTTTSNYLNHLQNYSNGNNCCLYKIDFERDDRVVAYYLTYDTFTNVTAGIWNIPEYNKIYIKLDNFMDGTFDILKPTTKKWDLTSGANHIKFLDGTNSPFDTTYTKLVMEKI
ncbi:MAG: hypothetical protein JWO06_1675 [Bacteroidota bacterium]|nr:hypothetical protein [Bacteroidota bacterium]